MKKFCLLLLSLSGNLFALSPSYGVRPTKEIKIHDIGEVWSAVSNFGNYGDPNTSFPSYDWPGGSGNYYLWEGRFWVGALVNGVPIVSHADYGNYEWAPSEGSNFWEGPGRSIWDFVCEYDDWDPSSNSNPLGIKVIQRALAWISPDYDDFIAYEYRLINVPGQGPGDLQDFYVSWVFDADVSGLDPTDLHMDDWVSYDGWVNGEWTTAYRPHRRMTDVYPYDEVTLLSDTTLDVPDGVLDQQTLFGDEPDEVTLHGDTLTMWRNFSYIYDGDNTSSPGDDEGENGFSIGYIGGTVLYAPLSPSDSVWVDSYGDTARMIRPFAHQWWNWNNDPGNDDLKYQFMNATHPSNLGYRFMPHPIDLGAPVFDYRFLYSFGPYQFADGETLSFVFAGVMGSSLNGGVVDSLRPTEWLLGLRRNADNALRFYYLGSQISDPLHPSGPYEDIHWGVPPTGVEDGDFGFLDYRYQLFQNFPNPFHSSTFIRYQIPLTPFIKGGQEGDLHNVQLSIYDITGRLVKTLINGEQEAGVHSLLWDGKDQSGKGVPSGVYFYRLSFGESAKTMKMELLR